MKKSMYFINQKCALNYLVTSVRYCNVLVALLLTNMCLNSCNNTNANDTAPPPNDQQQVREHSMPHSYENAFVLLADGTRSAENKYVIPHITEEQVLLLVDQMAKHGGGVLRIEGVGNDARSAKSSKFIIPALQLPQKPKKPRHEDGDHDFYKKEQHYKQQIELFKADSIKAFNDLLKYERSIQDSIKNFLAIYYKLKKKCSDINGAFNNAINFLNGAKAGNAVILLQGDQEHDMSICNSYKPVIPKIPAKYKLIQVAPNASDIKPILPCTTVDAIDASTIELFF